jgi:hypothetical protein
MASERCVSRGSVSKISRRVRHSSAQGLYCLLPVVFDTTGSIWPFGPMANTSSRHMLVIHRRHHLNLLAHKQGTGHSSHTCLIIVYQCTRTHSPHPPPWPGHSIPDGLIIVYQCTRTHSPPGLATRLKLS